LAIFVTLANIRVTVASQHVINNNNDNNNNKEMDKEINEIEIKNKKRRHITS